MQKILIRKVAQEVVENEILNFLEFFQRRSSEKQNYQRCKIHWYSIWNNWMDKMSVDVNEFQNKILTTILVFEKP